MSKIGEVKALIASRAEAVFLWSWMTILSCLIIGRGFPPLLNTFMAVFSSMLIATSVYIYNDVIDRGMDELNEVKKNRPIVAGRASVETAYQLVAVTGVLGLLASAYVNVETFISALSFFVIFFVYSMPQVRLKRMFIVKDLVIASGFILCSLIGSTAVTGGINWPGVFAGFSFGVLGFLVNPSINDSFDVEEDRRYGIRSLAAELSWQTQVLMLGAAVVYIVAASLYAALKLGFNILLPVPVVLFSLLVFKQLPVMYPEFDAKNTLRVRKTVKAFVFFTHLMFLVSRLNLGFLF